MLNIVTTIKKGGLGLRDSEIVELLFLINNQESLTNNDLVRLTGLPKETLKKFKSILGDLVLQDSNEDSLCISEKGKEVLSNLNRGDFSWCLYEGLDDKDLEFANKLDEIRKKYSLFPKREYDQFFATSISTVSKVKVLSKKGLISKKHIALLGDDDLVSICLGLMFPDYFNITVFDIDKELLSNIKRISDDLSLKNIHTIDMDFREDVNKELFGKFDIVITDPPYTAAGIKVFLSRGIDLISRNFEDNDKYIFLYYGNSFKSPEKTLKIQETINSFGLVVEDKIDKFARYFGAESIGSASSLYILKCSNHTHGMGNNEFSKLIYTYDLVKDEKFPFVDHVVLKLSNVPNGIVNSKSLLIKSLKELCLLHKFKVVDQKVTKFSNKGLSITYILSNSNLVIHTWPEYNAVHIDIITCSPIYNKEFLLENVCRIFNTSFVNGNFVE